jgi:hypothetical protein
VAPVVLEGALAARVWAARALVAEAAAVPQSAVALAARAWAPRVLVAEAAAVPQSAAALAARRVPVGAPRTAVKGSRWLEASAR